MSSEAALVRTRLACLACLAMLWSACGEEAQPTPDAPNADDGARCTPTGSTGLLVGETIEDLPFQHCSGEETSIHAECGPKATLLINFYAWCTTCYDYLRLAESLHAAHGTQGLRTFVVITETPLKNTPSLEYCAGFREQQALTATTLLDPSRALERMGKTDLVVVLDRDGKIVMSRIGPTTDAVTAVVAQELTRE